jgi:hypothetical protein
MATILLQAAGGFVGGLFGSVGSAIGTAAGALAGYAIDRALIAGTQRIEGPRLSGPRPFTAEDGASLPRVYGTARVGGTLIWATRFEETRQTTRQGFKGGPKVTEYSYFANVAFALAEGEVAGIRRVWADGRELDHTQVEMRFYQGTGTQAVDPLIEARQGAGNAPAYRDTAYVVFERFPLGDYGNRIPQFQFEVLRPVGRLAKAIRGIAMIPGSTEFGLSPSAVTRDIREGETDHLNRHVLTAGSDFMASLDELQALCPGLKHVALVVTWFGTDLRAGDCLIRPAVIDNGVTGFSQPWLVSGLTREEAPTVSYYDGGAAYGGSPSDRSVMEAIAEIRRRGLKVTLYPLVMMDVPHDNALPDPYGAAAQAPYPWRGRITCHPGPGQPGTTDKTATARTQVEAFCGSAAAGDFVAAGDTFTFAGSPGDWGFRRFVLHYAHLAVAAGGVDAFLIGSELRGLTTLRDGANAFPFVEALCDLAADVRSVVGAETKITYGADWSEYFGYQPDDGSGDVFFHLDPLWAHAAIDAVGIDDYMPLSDWRDADFAGGNPDGFEGPYDPDGLRAAVAGGEGFDWYYPSAAAREERLRAPISDGAYGKPWVFRYKDIAGWWSNPHFDRIAGVEAGSPTAWVPGAKPIWLTEIGCPAVDKGPNQPNVFPDPKSSENAAPHFSTGGRSDLAQHRYLQAHLDHWDPASPYFSAAGNPAATAYDGRMVDAERIYLWAWDARPFPAFPQRTDLWRDGGNWNLGHWLNGRLSGVTVGDLINAVLADHGLPPADVRNADGTMQGYVIEDPCPARAALEPVLDLYGIGAWEDGGGFVFAREGATATGAVPVGDMVAAGDRPAVEFVRMPDQDLPAEAVLGFRDPFAEYQSASARSVRLGAGGERQESIGFSGVLEQSEADGLLADWMQRKWRQRERATFAVALSETAIAPGALLSLPGAASGMRFLVDEVEEGLVKTVSAREVAGSVAARRRATAPASPPAPVPIYGRPQAIFLDLPMVAGGEERDQFRAALWAVPWKSQALYASPETTGFTLRAVASTPAFLGRLSTALAPGFPGRIDRANAIIVELHSGELSSVSRAQLLNGANAAAIRSASGVWEIAQFETAEETAPSVWRLTGLLRGQLGTDDAMASGAAAGADFVLLDEGVKPAGLLASEMGLTLNWRAGPAGQDFSTETFADQAVAGGLRARLPLSPVHLEARRLAGGDLLVSWIRRGRIDADSWDGDDIPIGEESEAYRIEVSTAAGTSLRTATAATQSWTYPAADIDADFPVLPATAVIDIRQMSAAVGAGLAARLEVALA